MSSEGTVSPCLSTQFQPALFSLTQAKSTTRLGRVNGPVAIFCGCQESAEYPDVSVLRYLSAHLVEVKSLTSVILAALIAHLIWNQYRPCPAE